MSNISKAIRHKRFQLDAKSQVKLYIETLLGSKYTLDIVDCSMNGIGAKLLDKNIKEASDLELNSIIPASKITIGENEYSLGRLVLRTVRTNNGIDFLGFSTIDMTVPVNGPLSKFLSEPLQNVKSPFDFELSPDKFSLANFVDSSHSNVDLLSRCNQFSIFLQDWKKTKKFAYNTVRTESKGTRINLTKKRKSGRNDYVIMGSNDYLGLASHPEVIKAVTDTVNKYGFGSTGSSLTTGITDIHEKLTEKLATMFKKEKALLYNSGYTANVGIINGITGAQDLITSDILAHASIHDAIQMSKATSRLFKHNDIQHLEKQLKENRSNYSGSLVITEGVFSMDGDVPPLNKIFEVSRKYNSRVMVDEAHSFGVIGENGLGVCEKYNLLDEVDIIMGTFSKICGGIGGFVVGSKELIEWLNFFSRPYMFSVSIPPSTAAAALKALSIFEKTPELVINLKQNIKHFVLGLKNLGFDLNDNHESSVIPVTIGDERKLGEINEILVEAGVFVVPIVYPAVSRTNCRFRFTMMATHTVADLDYALMVLEKAMKEVGFNPQNSSKKYESENSATNNIIKEVKAS